MSTAYMLTQIVYQNGAPKCAAPGEFSHMCIADGMHYCTASDTPGNLLEISRIPVKLSNIFDRLSLM